MIYYPRYLCHWVDFSFGLLHSCRPLKLYKCSDKSTNQPHVELQSCLEAMFSLLLICIVLILRTRIRGRIKVRLIRVMAWIALGLKLGIGLGIMIEFGLKLQPDSTGRVPAWDLSHEKLTFGVSNWRSSISKGFFWFFQKHSSNIYWYFVSFPS